MNNKITLKDVKKTRDISKLPINMQIYGKISPYVSYFFVRFIPLTPNEISFLWGIIGFLGIFFIGLGGYTNMVIGILIFHLALFIDFIDGEVARATGNTTLGGTYLDRLFHYLHRALLLFALGFGIWNVTGNEIYLYLGLWSSFILIFDNLSKLKVYETFVNHNKLDLLETSKDAYTSDGCQNYHGTFMQKVKAYAMELLRANNVLSLLFFAIIFNFVEAYLILMAVVSPIFFTRNFINIWKRVGNIPS